jgi:uncharacterized protein (TIGR03437 family)
MALTLLAPVAAQNTAAPVVNGIVTASAFGEFAAAAPGSWVEVYGSNLAGSARGWESSDFTGSSAPTSLDGVSVTVGGIQAFVSYISPAQVNIEIPDNVPTGGPAAVVVTYRGLASAAVMLTINAVEPGLFAPASFKVGGEQFVGALHESNGAFVSNGSIPGVPAAPAIAGETLVFYGTGFGPIQQGPVAGVIASGQTALANPFAMTIGGVPATVTYAGLVPGWVGSYQFDVVVPSKLPTGDLAVQFTLNGAAIGLQALFLSVSGAGSSGAFTLTSAAGANGGTLPAAYTCDGTGSTLPLSWSNPPAGTQEFALLLSTAPTPGTIKYDWVLYHIPAATTGLVKDTFLVGTVGVGDDGPGAVYDPPCSQGPGVKVYTFTVYALSAAPAFSVPANQVTGELVASAISSLTLGSAALSLGYSRDPSTAPGSSANCLYIRSSFQVAKSGATSIGCDGTYAYVGSIGMPVGSVSDAMMNGITSTNLQVPTPTDFQGANGWKLPLNPMLAQSPTPVPSGPIGVAINGIPIFNPCVQNGNCTATNGDTRAEGQLDTCNGHAGRADDYHYHAAPTCLMAEQPNSSYWNDHPVGWLLDGFAVFGYDNADGSAPARDPCGGSVVSGSQAPAGYPYGYAYHVMDTFPYITDNCVSGVPSPDLAHQGSKYNPMRQPPVTPFNVSNMTLTTDPTDGYQVLQFTSATPFTTTETGTDSYANSPGTYQIRYKQVTGDALTALLALKQNAGATACWNFEFVDSNGNTTQPSVSYCKTNP